MEERAMKTKNFFEGKSFEEIKNFFGIRSLKNFLIEHFHKSYTPNYEGDVKIDVFERERAKLYDELALVAVELVELVKNEAKNEFAKAVATTVANQRGISEKQAYVIARGAWEEKLYEKLAYFEILEWEAEKEAFEVQQKLEKRAKRQSKRAAKINNEISQGNQIGIA
jgi:hypothetical protein